VVVSGLHTEWGKILLNDETSILTEDAQIDMDKVLDDYVELRFDYRSIYAHELPNLDLSGKLTRAYTLTPDRRYCVPTDLQT
jgi:hypothetical protein